MARPRDPSLDGRVLRATIEVLAERGLSGTRIDDVAARSGVPKSSIYRRWPGLRHLVLDAMEAAVGDRSPEQTGDPIADLVALIRLAGGSLLGNPFGGTLFHVGADLANDPELGVDYRARLIEPVREQAVGLVREAQEQGRARPDVDPCLVFDQVVGLIVYRELLLHRPVTTADLELLVDDTLRRLAPSPGR